MLAVVARAPDPAAAQAIPATVNCQAARLDLAERETCASPALQRLTSAVDSLTRRLEATLTGLDRDALVDTEQPFKVQRNNCHNADGAIHPCVEEVLRHRLDVLTAAQSEPGAIVEETSRYTFLEIAFLRKWGRRLIGRRISVWGCLDLKVPEARSPVTTTIEACSPDSSTDRVPVTVRIDPTRIVALRSRRPAGWWAGLVEEQGGRLMLSGITP